MANPRTPLLSRKTNSPTSMPHANSLHKALEGYFSYYWDLVHHDHVHIKPGVQVKEDVSLCVNKTLITKVDILIWKTQFYLNPF